MKHKRESRLIAGGLLGVVAAIAVPALADEVVQPEIGKAEAKIVETTATGDDQAKVVDVAATNETEELRALVKQLTERLDKLEGEQKKTSAQVQATSKTGVKSKFQIDASGLVQVQGLFPFSQSGPEADRPETFRLRRGELTLRGTVSDRVSGTLRLDLAKASSSYSASGTVLQEIFATYRLGNLANKTRETYIDIGQYKLPLGYESQISSSALPLIENALIYQVKFPGNDGNYGNGRDTGVQVRGKINKLEYALGAFNGFSERQNSLDNDDSKVVAGRLIFRPSNNWYVGGSAGTGNRGRRVTNAFVGYDQSKWWINAEYLQGKADAGDGKGYFATTGYRFNPKWEAVARYDVVDLDNVLGKATEATLGLNYYIKGNNAKIQANIVKHNGEAGTYSGQRNDFTEFRTQFQVAF